jgi:hypothetical protein
MNENAIRNLERRAEADRSKLKAAEPDVAEFKKLEKAGALGTLMKGSVDAATLSQGSPVSNNNFSVLIPQDISHMVYSTMLKREERCVFVQNLEREPVKQVKRERVIKKRHGNPFIPLGMGEKSLPGVNRPLLDRIVATVQYYGVMPTLTHVAQNVSVLQGKYPVVAADGEGGLKFERESGIESLAEKLESVYWNGDNDFDADEGDGFFRQLDAGGVAGTNVIDLRNQYLTFDKFIDYLAGLMQIDFEGKPSAVYMPTELWAPLAKEAATKNRLDPAKGVEIVWNKALGQLLMFGPTGQQLELRHALFISPDWKVDNFPADGQSGTDFWPMTEANLVGAALTSPTGVSVSQTSYFEAGDAGNYIYKFMPIFKKGHPAAFTCTSLSIADGDVAKADFNDAAFSSTLVGYQWWRSEKDSSTVFHYGGKFGRNTLGANGGTLWFDTNKTIPGTFRAAAVHHGDGAITDDVLLDAFQDDMGRVERELRMVLGTYRGLSVNMPRKHLSILNARGISF